MANDDFWEKLGLIIKAPIGCGFLLMFYNFLFWLLPAPIVIGVSSFLIGVAVWDKDYSRWPSYGPPSKTHDPIGYDAYHNAAYSRPAISPRNKWAILFFVIAFICFIWWRNTAGIKAE